MNRVELIRRIRSITGSDLKNACAVVSMLAESNYLRFEPVNDDVNGMRASLVKHPPLPSEPIKITGGVPYEPAMIQHTHPGLEAILTRIATVLEADLPAVDCHRCDGTVQDGQTRACSACNSTGRVM